VATWSDKELSAAVDAYRHLEAKLRQGEKVNKKQVYRDLSERFGRSPGAWEYRMQNISHVLHELAKNGFKVFAPRSMLEQMSPDG